MTLRYGEELEPGELQGAPVESRMDSPGATSASKLADFKKLEWDDTCTRCGKTPNIAKIDSCRCYKGGLLQHSVYATHAAEVERTNTRGAIRRTLEERARDRMSAVVGAMLAGAPEHDIPSLPADVIADACLAAAAELRRMR